VTPRAKSQFPTPWRARPIEITPAPSSQYAARFAETAREAGAANPEQLGEQLALLLDGASARTRVLNTDTFPTAAVLIDNAIPTTAPAGASVMQAASPG
jgi:hypothetical protein